VAEAEARVEEFRAKSNLLIGANNTTLSNQQLAEVNSQLAGARSRKAESEAKAQFIRDTLKSGKSLESTDFLNSELIRRLAEQRVTLRAQLAEQSSTLLDAHLRIKELKAQIADLDRAIRDEAEKLARSLENDARIAGARLESLSDNLERLKRQAASTNGQDVQLRALERDAKSQRDLLEFYLAKYRETTARDSLGAIPADVRIISRATVSNTPFFPKKRPIVLIAGLATLFIVAGWVTTRELLLGNPYRIASVRLSAALDGPAPKPEGEPAGKDSPPPAPAAAAPSATAGAALAGIPAERLLADLAAELRRGDRRRVLLAGADRETDSTMTALALARVLAREARVVVVDLAFAAPRLAAVSVDPGGPGLADHGVIRTNHHARAGLARAPRCGGPGPRRGGRNPRFGTSAHGHRGADAGLRSRGDRCRTGARPAGRANGGACNERGPGREYRAAERSRGGGQGTAPGGRGGGCHRADRAAVARRFRRAARCGVTRGGNTAGREPADARSAHPNWCR
jgi:succinoglycan biosynthesis transport protein ExoP